jgi:hypothetical protein
MFPRMREGAHAHDREGENGISASIDVAVGVGVGVGYKELSSVWREGDGRGVVEARQDRRAIYIAALDEASHRCNYARGNFHP